MKKIFLPITILVFSSTLLSQNIDTHQFAKWINENSMVLNENSGLERLAEKLADKTVIGLGECVHGSKTVNNVRIGLAKAMITNNDFNVIAFEMPFNIGLRINEYLLTGLGDIREILNEGHFFTRSTEILNFINWIKQYNEQSDKQVVFYGFDIQSNIDLVEDLLKFYAKTDKEAETLVTALFEIFANKSIWEYNEYSVQLRDSVIEIISCLKEKHVINRKNYILNSGFIEYEYSGKRIEVLDDCLQMINSGYGQAMKMRDSCNARLVQWIKNFEGKNSKVVLFAHNGHLGKSLRLLPREQTFSTQGFYEDYSKELITGYYLREMFDDKYCFIGTQFASGFFMGFDSGNNNHLSKLEVTSPEVYSFPHLLQQANQKSPFFIDFTFSRTTSRQIINYFCSFQSFYEIGADYKFKYAKARLIDYFDAIIYVDKVEESDLF